MPHPDTDALVERIFKESRETLYAHAARFFDGSINRERAGLDAHHLVGEVLARILKAGKLHNQANPEAYIRKAITNAGIDTTRRDSRYQELVPRLAEHTDQATPSHESASVDEVAAALAFKSAIPELPERAQRVAQAKIDHPDLNNSQLATLLDISRDTVGRAISDMRNHELLRSLVRPDTQPPPTTTHDTPRRNTHDRPDAA